MTYFSSAFLLLIQVLSSGTKESGDSEKYVQKAKQGPTVAAVSVFRPVYKIARNDCCTSCLSVRMEQLCCHWTDFGEI
jgi:hypothetical protein